MTFNQTVIENMKAPVADRLAAIAALGERRKTRASLVSNRPLINGARDLSVDTLEGTTSLTLIVSDTEDSPEVRMLAAKVLAETDPGRALELCNDLLAIFQPGINEP